MKKILVKFANWINKKYRTEIELSDVFTYRGHKYYIVNCSLKQEIGCIDELQIIAHKMLIESLYK